MIAVIDLDFILYVCTQGVKQLDENNEPIKVENKFVYLPKTFEKICEDADNFINQILEKTKADSYLAFFTSGSFRKNIGDKTYKKNREGSIKPDFFKELKQYLIDKWKVCLDSEFLTEGDDYLGIYANYFGEKGIVYRLCSPDKDILYGISGFHYNPVKDEWVDILPIEASKNFWTQMITGDTSDGVSALPKKGIKFAERLFLNIDDEESYRQLVFEEYINHYGEYLGIQEFTNTYLKLKILDKPLNPDTFVYLEPIEVKKEISL